MHSLRRIASLGIAAFFALDLAILPQERQTAPPPTAPAAAPAKLDKKKHSHTDDFLIRGTVFTESGLSFPGIQLRIRRTSEKKFRWETLTNSHGDFAIRVPQGSQYEVVVHGKHFVEQAKTVDAKSGEREERIVFRMESPSGSKK